MEHLFNAPHDWPKILLPAIPWAEKIIRPLIVYLFLLGAFRLSGKRELGQATLFDFLIILLISNVVQNAIIGEDNSILGSFAGVVTLLVLSYMLNRATSRSVKARQTLEGMPTLLVYHGEILDGQMTKENVSRNDLLMALRQQGIASLTDVRYAILELTGNISIIQENASKPDSRNNCVTAFILEQSPIDPVEMHLRGEEGSRPDDLQTKGDKDKKDKGSPDQQPAQNGAAQKSSW